MTYAAFLDIDGTLVNYACQLPPSAVQAIRRARQNGHRIYICSGRSRAEIYSELWEIGLDGYIGANGAYIEDNGQTLFHQHFSRSQSQSQSQSILQWLQARRFEYYLESNDGLYASPTFFRTASALYGNASDAEAALRNIFLHMRESLDPPLEKINKISFYLNNAPQDLAAAAQHFPAACIGSGDANRHDPQFGDIGTKNITKGDAIRRVLQHHGLNKAHGIALGDADAAMFAACGTGMAMGNAKDSLKALADFVTRDVDDGGLAHAFARLGLTGEL